MELLGQVSLPRISLEEGTMETGSAIYRTGIEPGMENTKVALKSTCVSCTGEFVVLRSQPTTSAGCTMTLHTNWWNPTNLALVPELAGTVGNNCVTSFLKSASNPSKKNGRHFAVAHPTTPFSMSKAKVLFVAHCEILSGRSLALSALQSLTLHLSLVVVALSPSTATHLAAMRQRRCPHPFGLRRLNSRCTATLTRTSTPHLIDLRR